MQDMLRSVFASEKVSGTLGNVSGLIVACGDQKHHSSGMFFMGLALGEKKGKLGAPPREAMCAVRP